MFNQSGLKFLMFKNKISDPNDKIAIEYFTKESASPAEIARIDPIIGDLAKSFNLKDIKPEKILKRSDDILAHPNETLRVCLEYDRQIDPSYFYFWSNLLDQSSKIRITSSQARSIAPQLYRSLKCLSFQFENVLFTFSSGKDASLIPYVAFSSLQFIIRSVFQFPEDIKPHFLRQLLPIFACFENKLHIILSHSPELKFINDLFEILNAVNQCIYKLPINEPFLIYYLHFLISTIYCLSGSQLINDHNYTVFTDFVTIIENFKTIIDKKYLDICLKTSGNILTLAPTFTGSKDLVLSMTGRAIYLLGIFPSESSKESMHIVSFIQWVIAKSINVEVIEANEIPFPTLKYDFFEQKIINIKTFFTHPSYGHLNHRMKERKMSSIMEEALGKFKEPLFNLSNNCPEVATAIASEISSNITTPQQHLFLADFLSCLDPNIIIILNSVKPHRALINHYLFGDAPEIPFYDQLRESTMTALSLFSHLCVVPKEIFGQAMEFLNPALPVQCSRVFAVIEDMFATSPSNTERGINDSVFIERTIDADLHFKANVLNGGSEDFFKARNSALSLITCLIENERITQHFFDTEYFTQYIFSLLFEENALTTAAQVLKCGIFTTKASKIAGRVAKFTEEATSDTIPIIVLLLNNYKEAFQNGSVDAANDFTQESLDIMIAKMCSRLLDDRVLQASFNVYYYYASLHSDNSDRLERIIEIMKPALDATADRPRTAQALANISVIKHRPITDMEGHAPHIKCSAFLKLLYDRFLHDQDVIPFFEYLALSVSNVFIMFQAGLLLDIVRRLDERTIKIVSRCLRTYCSMEELSALFDQMVANKNKKLILKEMSKMVERSITIPEKMLVKQHAGIVSPCYDNLKEFTVSFNAISKSEKGMPVLRISSNRNSITIVISDTISIVVKAQEIEETFVLQLKKPIQGKTLVKLNFSGKTVKFGNGQSEQKSVISFDFAFNSGPALFYFERFLFDISDIKIETKSPLVYKTVPPPLSIVYNLTEVGMEQLVPVFSEEVRREVIDLVLNLVKTNIRITDTFIYAYSHWLRSLEINALTADDLQQLILTCKALQQRPVQIFLHSFWFDFEFWNKFDDAMKQTVIKKIKEYSIDNEETFYESIDFGIVLSRVIPFINENNIVIDLSYLERWCSKGPELEPEEVALIADYLLDPNIKVTLRERLAHLMYLAATSCRSSFIQAVDFAMFFQTFGYSHLLQIYSLHLIAMDYKYSKGDPERLFRNVNRAIADLQDMSYERSFSVAFGLMMRQQYWKASELPAISMASSDIKVPQFFALCLGIITKCPQNIVPEFRTLLLNELLNNSKSRKALSNIPGWIFLVSFLYLGCDASEDSVIEAIVNIAKDSQTSMEQLYISFAMLESCSKWNLVKSMTVALKSIKCNEEIPIIHYLFMPKFNSNSTSFKDLPSFMNGVLNTQPISYRMKPDKNIVTKPIVNTINRILSQEFDKLSFSLPNALIASSLIGIACEAGIAAYDVCINAYLSTCEKIDPQCACYLKGINLPDAQLQAVSNFINAHNIQSCKIAQEFSLNIPNAAVIISKYISDKIAMHSANIKGAYSEMFFAEPYDFSPVIRGKYDTERKRADHERATMTQHGYNKAIQRFDESGLVSRSTIKHYRMITRYSGFSRPVYKPNHRYSDHHDASASRDQSVSIAKKECEKGCHIMITRAMREAEFREEATVVTIEYNYRGLIVVYESQIIFYAYERFCPFGEVTEVSYKNFIVPTSHINMALVRSYEHIVCGYELFTRNVSLLVRFEQQEDMKQFGKVLQKKKVYVGSGLKVLKDKKIIAEWQAGRLSVDEYLKWVNAAAGRSFSDLSQFPVFPWVGESTDDPKSGRTTEDIASQVNKRDMSKTIGSMNPARYANLDDDFDPDGPAEANCHFRMFYSTAGAIVNMLMRLEPFMSLHILLQDGHIDVADRLFASVPFMWNSVTGMNNDFRELCPHYYECPSIYTNDNNVDLGRNQRGEQIDTVRFAWGLKNPYDFCAVSRSLLERSRATVNEWIDLVFGRLQRGVLAIDHKNDFHPYCYDDALEKYPELQDFIKSHASNFGCVPQQIFQEPSPSGGKYKKPVFGRPIITQLDCGPLQLVHTYGSEACAVRMDDAKAIPLGKNQVRKSVRMNQESMTAYFNDGKTLHRCCLLKVASTDPRDNEEITVLGYRDGCLLYYREGQMATAVHRDLRQVSVLGSTVASCGGGIVRLTEFPRVRTRMVFENDCTLVACCKCGVVCASPSKIEFYSMCAVRVASYEISGGHHITRFVRGFKEFICLSHESGITIYEAMAGRDVITVRLESSVKISCYWPSRDAIVSVLFDGTPLLISFEKVL